MKVRHRSKGWAGTIQAHGPDGQVSILADGADRAQWFDQDDFTMEQPAEAALVVVADLSRAARRPCEVRPFIRKGSGL